ncbi:MAG: hypothetical protein AAF990_00130 [Bacteroidota bacterium]
MIGLLSIGALLRVLHYAGNRSLWYDEAMLAINFVRRDFIGLLDPLAYGQNTNCGRWHFLFFVNP